MKPTKPLPTRRYFLARMVRNFGLMLTFIAFSLAMGSAGYHYFAKLPWLDATLNASMILSGMGPIAPLESSAAKFFGIGYTLYSGVAFLTAVAVLFAPVVGRFLHRFHLKLYDEA